MDGKQQRERERNLILQFPLRAGSQSPQDIPPAKFPLPLSSNKIGTKILIHRPFGDI